MIPNCIITDTKLHLFSIWFSKYLNSNRLNCTHSYHSCPGSPGPTPQTSPYTLCGLGALVGGVALHNRAESAAPRVTRGSRTLGARRLVRVDGCSGSCPPPPRRADDSACLLRALCGCASQVAGRGGARRDVGGGRRPYHRHLPWPL